MQKDIIYVSIIAILAVLFFMSRDKINKLERDKNNLSSIIHEKDDSITYYKNESGQNVAQKEAAVLRANQLEEHYPKLIEEIKKDFDIKLKNLRVAVQNDIKASGTGNASVVHHHYHDSAGQTKQMTEVKVNDGYLDFTAKVYDSLNAPYQYTYEDTITTVLSIEKKWFGFGREKMLASTKLNNPNARVINTTNVVVDSYKDKRWVLFVGAGYGVAVGRDQVQWGPTINVGVGRALLKF